MTINLKEKVKQIAPAWLLSGKRAIFRWIEQRHFQGKSNRAIFSEIYRRKLWGDEGEFCSGTGSVQESITAPYVLALVPIVESARGPVVDLGCGDVKVGSQLFPYAPAGYIAVDVVDELIAKLKETYRSESNVTFVCADMTSEPLPSGDVAIVRQVFQHLPNAAVQSVLEKLRQFRIAVITEHQPAKPTEINRDKPPGPGIRLEQGSGLYLEHPPFSVAGRFELLLEVPGDGRDPERSGYIRTFIWEPGALPVQKAGAKVFR